MKDIKSIDKDFTQDENGTLIATLSPGANEADHQKQEAYWIAQLTGELPVLNFPGYKSSRFAKNYQREAVNYTFLKDVREKLIAFSREQHVSLFTLLMAGVNILLHKYTRQCDIITGTRSDGMSMPDTNDIFINTLMIRTLLDKESSIKHFLKLQQQVLLGAFEHRKYPFDELIGKLNDRTLPDSGLPEVFVVLKSGEQSVVPSMDIDHKADAHTRTSGHGIYFTFNESDVLQLVIAYNSDVYDKEVIGRMAGHYEQVMLNMMADDSMPVKSIGYITNHEVQELLAFNNIQVDCPENKTIIDLFEEQAKLVPDNTAVIFNSKSLTYRELDERSDQLANYLVNKGVKRNACVLLCFNNSMDKSIIGILGIMKAGGHYVPIDSDLPKERITYLIEDTRAVFVVTNRVDAGIFENEKIHVINLDETASDWCAAPADKNYGRVKQHDLAYVIYTSGTTGNPKGVMISHRNLVDYFFGLNKRIGIEENKVNGLMSTLATDLGNTVLFGSLIYGNTLHLFSKDSLRNVDYIHSYFNDNNIDCIKIVPTYWKSLEYRNSFILPGRMIIFGGEALSANTINKIRNARPEIRIINHYGPTETTIGKLLYEVKNDTDENVIPIGRPFSNTHIYIVDEELSLCAKGIWGELLIGGEGVFQGYLNRVSLTEEKCIENKFLHTNERLYRTGDLVRINENGEIEFGSRFDNQVKIHGYRIELGEIGAVIMQYPYIKECYVDAVENSNADKILVAYLEVRDGYPEEDFKEYLKNNLPAYMIPSILVKIPGLPMTSNGKVDKKKLPGIELLKVASGFEAPQNEIQRVIVGILEEVFNREPISINDNFFELGGDSIKSIQVVARLRQRGYSLQLREIIKNPIVRDFSDQVKVNASFKVKEDMVSGLIPLSPIQKYFFESKKGDYNHYNQSVILFAGEIKEDYIRKAFDELNKFHDTLRIKYKSENEHLWKQYYDGSGETYLFETAFYIDEGSFRKKMDMLSKSLDIQQGPLIKMCLFKGKENDILFIVIHHLLIDGVSFRILIEDLSGLYRKFLFNSDFELRHKSSSLKEWQIKLLEYSKKEALAEELKYWQQVDKSEFDSIRPGNAAVKNTISERERFLLTLDEVPTADLLTKCYRKYNAEINEILITALCLSLREAFNLKRILLNMEGHGREDIGHDLDVSRTLGWFTTIFPVYFDLNALDGYVNTLLEVKANLNGIPVKGIGYGVLKYLKEQHLDVQPEITFNYLGDFSSGLRNNAPGENVFQDIKFNYQDASELTACSDILSFTGIIENKKLSICINFNKLLFSDQEIRTLGNAYNSHLLKIINHIALS